MKLHESMKVKLFTHTDLDGVGCEIVGRMAFEDIDVTHCDYYNVNEIIAEFIKAGNHINYDVVFITDISVNQSVAKIIDDTISNRVSLIDHHDTAKWMNDEYYWAYVNSVSNNGKESGTNLFFEYLRANGIINPQSRYYDALSILVEKIRRYDTWEWVDIYDDKEAGALNQLLYLVGRKPFADSIITKLIENPVHSYSDGSWHQMLDKSDKTIIDVDNAKRDAYIIRKNKQMKVIGFNSHNVGIVFAEQYISELGNELSNMNKNLKYIMIIDMGSQKVSLRTTHNDIHLGKDVASEFGGGGHPKASGFGFNDKIVLRAIGFILNNTALAKVLKLIDKLVK